jgi:hypothetical protein
VFNLADWYRSGATDGARGMQGEHLVIAAFARQRFLLIGEEANNYGGKIWHMKHDLDFIFERDGAAYGVEVKKWKWDLMLVVVIAGFVGLPYKTLLHL